MILFGYLAMKRPKNPKALHGGSERFLEAYAILGRRAFWDFSP
jgi:hypothetical protein